MQILPPAVNSIHQHTAQVYFFRLVTQTLENDAAMGEGRCAPTARRSMWSVATLTWNSAGSSAIKKHVLKLYVLIFCSRSDLETSLSVVGKRLDLLQSVVGELSIG